MIDDSKWQLSIPPFNNFWGGGGDISGGLKVSRKLSVASISTDNKSFT